MVYLKSGGSSQNFTHQARLRRVAGFRPDQFHTELEIKGEAASKVGLGSDKREEESSFQRSGSLNSIIIHILSQKRSIFLSMTGLVQWKYLFLFGRLLSLQRCHLQFRV